MTTPDAETMVAMIRELQKKIAEAENAFRQLRADHQELKDKHDKNQEKQVHDLDMKAISAPTTYDGKDKANFPNWADDMKNFLAARDIQYQQLMEMDEGHRETLTDEMLAELASDVIDIAQFDQMDASIFIITQSYLS